MPELVVGLDLHLKKTQGTIMSMNGEILKQERFNTSKEDLEKFLEGLPASTEVALESVGFCWPWIDLIDELGYTPLLANPIKVKAKAEDLKTDKVDSELLAHMTRMNWLPTVFVPSREIRWLRNLLRHRAFGERSSGEMKTKVRSSRRPS